MIFTNSILFRLRNSLNCTSCLSLTRGFLENESNAYMKYLFCHDFFKTILLLKGENIWIISSLKICKFLKPVVKFIQEKKDNSPISQLRLITRSKKKINFEEELFTKVLEEASITKEDIIGMFINDQKYTTSKIIRK